MHNNFNVWVVDDEQSIRWVIEKSLSKYNINTQIFSNAKDLLNALQQQTPDAILSDIKMPDIDGLQLLDSLQKSYPNLPVIIMTAHSDLDSAVATFHGGAFEYITKPFDITDMVDVVQRACIHGQQNYNHTIPANNTLLVTPEIIGEAPAMQEVFRAIGRLARSNITVLINGQSGTGKELVAQALHKHSPRAKSAFIALNMAAIPKDLMESELFGHEKGAFTGAINKRVGMFMQANNGTLFLDEIGDMPMELQTRLLRVLSNNEFYAVGASTPTKVNVRIIAATHQNLEDLVDKGLFREDLFHRLNVIRIHIPPLNQRKEDIPLLIQHFLSSAAIELDTEKKQLTKEAEQYLTNLEWRGNVRELENTCRWLTVMAAGRDIYLNDLPSELLSANSSASFIDNPENSWQIALNKEIDSLLLQGEVNIAKQIISSVEVILIRSALKHSNGRRNDAANLLGLGRNTLTRKIKELII